MQFEVDHSQLDKMLLVYKLYDFMGG